MARFKSHPVFVITLSLLLAVAVGAGVMFYLTLDKVSAAARTVKQKSQTLAEYTRREPFPSGANLEAVRADLANAEQLVASMQAALKGRGQFAKRMEAASLPAGSTEAYFDLANFVESMRSAAEVAEVAVPVGTRFGFMSYASTEPDKALIPQVHRQRLVAEYLLTTLFKAKPQELVSLQRNQPESPDAPISNTPASASSSSTRNLDGDYFSIDNRMTAAVPGFIEATAFKLTFIGYSGALRDFLNEVASFDLPLVVRSVEVEPAASPKDTVKRAVPAANSLSALFGTSTPAAPAAVEAKPIVDQNRSRFTVTIEYINLVETNSDTQPTP